MPGAEDIDEDAARRSTRVILIITSAVIFLPLLGLLVVVLIHGRDDGPAGGRDSLPAWAVVLPILIVGIVVAPMMLWARRQYRRPVYRRALQYGRRRRRSVVKDLRHGRPLSAEDMPVASALVDLLRSQRRFRVVLYGGMPFVFLFNGLVQHGVLRWLEFGLAACWLVLMPFVMRQQRQMIRNYERQSPPSTDHHQGEASP
jgi:MFS family permease